MNTSKPTPVELSQILIEKTKRDLESASCGFKVTVPIIAEHLSVSISMIRKVRKGEKEFGRATFRRLAESANRSFDEYVLDLLKWGVLELPRLRCDHSPQTDEATATSDAVEDAFLRLDRTFSEIRKEIRTRAWNPKRFSSGDCRVEDSRQTFMVVFSAVAKFMDLISVRFLKSAAVIFHRGDSSDAFGYGLRRDYRCSDWETPFLTDEDIPSELSREIIGVWTQDSPGHSWLQAYDVCIDAQSGGSDGAHPFFSTHSSADRSDRILVRPVHAQFHPVGGINTRTDSTRTSLLLRFAQDDTDIVTHVAESLADRLVDMLEYVRLVWIQDLAFVRSLTDSSLSMSLRALPPKSTQLTRLECEQRVSKLARTIESSVIRSQTDQHVIKQGKSPRVDRGLHDLLAKLMAFDFWVFDEDRSEFHSHWCDGFSVTMPMSSSHEVIDSSDGRRVDYRFLYQRYLGELKPSGVGGKSIACIADQCFLNVERDFETGMMKRAVRLLERGNQVAIPFDLVDGEESGSYRRLSHAIGWFRLSGKHSTETIIDFVGWIDSITRNVDGVKIRIRSASGAVDSVNRKRKLKRAEIQNALDAGERVLTGYLRSVDSSKHSN